MNTAAIGFRVKSGWALAVLLSGPAASPKVLDRRTVQLADPEAPDSTQPYHAGLELPAATGKKEVARLVKVVERFADRSMSELFGHYVEGGHTIVGVGIAVGSVVDPSSIANDHIRAHAEEGRLFRVVIEGAARKRGFETKVVVEKKLLGEAATALHRSEGKLKEDVTTLGRAIGGRWRTEEKAATLAAWLALGPQP